MTWVLLIAAIAAEVLATSALRALAQPVAGGGWWWIAVVGGYGSAFALLYAALAAGAPLAVSYAIWAGAGVAATALVALFVFHERLSAWSALGMVLIVVGVVTVELGQRATEVTS